MSDWVRAFEVPALRLRGALLRLRGAWRELAARGARDAGDAATHALAESVACAALLDGTLGLRASVSLQVRNAAPVALLFAECTSDGALRGVARPGGEDVASAVLALTVEEASGMRQQAHVPFERDGVAASLAAHFLRSDRLPTRWLVAHDDERIAALLLQSLDPHGDPSVLEEAVASTRALHPGLHDLATDELLLRVFTGEDVRLFDERSLRFGCSCSRERVVAALRGIDPAELEDAHAAPLEVACECCGADYRIAREELVAGNTGIGSGMGKGCG
ncbi:MAG TPA: Hsp33 family molecular chaperone HslO [Xanthomonadales bacterium]|nr:Hsp33 family molecular chaperone HslO [Xanthomonadales bacterium]